MANVHKKDLCERGVEKLAASKLCKSCSYAVTSRPRKSSNEQEIVELNKKYLTMSLRVSE